MRIPCQTISNAQCKLGTIYALTKLLIRSVGLALFTIITRLSHMKYCNARAHFLTIGTVGLFALLFTGKTFAAWYQAQGQALVRNGDVRTARLEATNDAVRQALLFSGASVSGTQTIVNGLMANDAFHMDTSGEVRRIEKVTERRRGNILDITIRADIFPKRLACSATSAPNSLITSPFRVKFPGQLLAGNIQGLNRAVMQEFERLLREGANNVYLDSILPFTVDWQSGKTIEQAIALGKQHDVQLVLFGEIEDTSIVKAEKAWSRFGKRQDRQFRVRIELIDTINGAVIHEAYYSTSAIWRFAHHQSVSPVSRQFWQSEYGIAIYDVLTQMLNEIEDVVACQPSTGRILSVNNNQVIINMGREQGLELGDNVSLYQKNQLFDEFGKTYIQYNLHPDKMRVVSINVDNAILEPESGGLLGNIQPNDFVTLK